MLTRYKLWILITIVFVLTMSACGLDLAGLPADLLDDGSGPLDEPTGPQKTDLAEAGQGSVQYYYTMNHPNLEFKIDQVIPLVIYEPAYEPGIWEVSGLREITVEYRMAGGTAATRCDLNCQVILSFEATGTIQLDPDTKECTIPMSFNFLPKADEWILDTDCPEKVLATFDCAGTSKALADISVYTFRSTHHDITQVDSDEVTLRAVLKELIMPVGVKGICNW